jgi:hypothetical protein
MTLRLKRPIRVERAERTTKRRINRGSLPAHLPHIEMVVDIEDHNCPCCGQAPHRIGEDAGERLDIVPAQFRVLVVRRPNMDAEGGLSAFGDRPLQCGQSLFVGEHELALSERSQKRVAESEACR